jgi:hypothetical protein
MGALDPGLDRLREQLVEEIRASEARTRQYVEARLGTVEAQLRQHIDTTAAETRRHFDVVGERLRSDIKLGMEGLVALDEKVERFRGETRKAFTRLDRRFLHLEARVISARERR